MTRSVILAAAPALAAAALLGGCAHPHAITPRVAGAGVDFGDARAVEVRLSSFAFTPATITLDAGRPVVLRLVSASSGRHDFTAPEFFAAARVAPQDAAKLSRGQVDLAGRQTATIRLVPAAGTYDIACSHFGHAALGMTGKIVVR